MSDHQLRKRLIRLAHSNPELRPDLLPLLKTGGKDKGPGVPDGTGPMKDSPECPKNKEESKTAGCEKMPEGPLRENCEKAKENGGVPGGKKKKKKKGGVYWGVDSSLLGLAGRKLQNAAGQFAKGDELNAHKILASAFVDLSKTFGEAEGYRDIVRNLSTVASQFRNR